MSNNLNATVSKQVLQQLIDSAVAVMKLIPNPTDEQKRAFAVLDNNINAVINAVNQVTASNQSFAGKEMGTSQVDPTKSSFL